LGEFYEYVPTLIEVRVGAGIFSIGFMVFTVLCKIAIPLIQGTHDAPAQAAPAGESVAAV
jgi:Ni/Fe-hydrogenase subunit HybB-like protein